MKAKNSNNQFCSIYFKDCKRTDNESKTRYRSFLEPVLFENGGICPSMYHVHVVRQPIRERDLQLLVPSTAVSKFSKGKPNANFEQVRCLEQSKSVIYRPFQWRIYIVKFWTRAPRGSKFFQFHAVFGKIWQNRMLAPPLGSWRPLLGEILDPPLLLPQLVDSSGKI